MLDNINTKELTENCDRIARKDIRINGYPWKSHRYFYNAMKAFESHPAIESIHIECEIVIDGDSYPGMVMMHRDGRVYPMMRDTFDKIYGAA